MSISDGADRAEEPVTIDDHTVDLPHRDDIVGATERPHRDGESAASCGGRRLGEHLDGVAGPTARKCSLRTGAPTVVCPFWR